MATEWNSPSRLLGLFAEFETTLTLRTVSIAQSKAQGRWNLNFHRFSPSSLLGSRRPGAIARDNQVGFLYLISDYCL